LCGKYGDLFNCGFSERDCCRNLQSCVQQYQRRPTRYDGDEIRGAVLRNAAGFGCMSSILRGHAAPAVVVVSAFGSSTRMLEVAAETARNGEQELALAMGRSVVAEKQGTCTRDSHRRGNGRNTTGGYCTAPCLFRGMAFTLTQQNLRRQNRIIKAEELPPATVTRQ
jgi:hypothetical protein